MLRNCDVLYGDKAASTNTTGSALRDGRLMEGLELHAIGKWFREHEVLREVSMVVRTGEIVGLFGPDGAGKTTCFEVILGLTKPDCGRITLNGVDITRLPTYRRAALGLAYLAQEPSVFRGLTVEQNIRAMLEISETDPHARQIRLEELLKDFSLDHLRNRRAAYLSGGERRRCEIVRALASDPSVILLDEPFAGIDPITIAEIETLIRQLKSRGTGVLITDYNLHEMLELVDRAYVLIGGKVMFEGNRDELIADERVQKMYFGRAPVAKERQLGVNPARPASSMLRLLGGDQRPHPAKRS